jgi:hypothetical protein
MGLTSFQRSLDNYIEGVHDPNAPFNQSDDNYDDLIIDHDLLQALDDYHDKSLAMQQYHFEGNPQKLTEEQFKFKVNDDLVFHVPIYDMRDRRYAAFSSLLEALRMGSADPKGNGKFFVEPKLWDFEWTLLFYLFRLCGSGINYTPKLNKDQSPFGTHGFGNFWLVKSILDMEYGHEKWLDRLKSLDKPFTDNKGYLLPQFSYKDQSGGHLKRFILEESVDLVDHLYSFITKSKREIYEVVDHGNAYLKSKGFKKQNFVLSAFAMDVAEYYPNLVDQYSRTYAGTNAQRCLKALFKKNKKMGDFDFFNRCMSFLAERYDTTPYSVEDSRACDPVRYFQEYQSEQHIAKNNGVIYKNNSVLKQLWGDEKYYKFAQALK